MTNKSRSQIEKDRLRFINDKEDTLLAKIKADQAALYTKLFELISELITKDGKLVFSATNTAKTKKISGIIQVFNATRAKALAKWIYNGVVELFGLNKSYFERVNGATQTARDARVRKRIMDSLGYDEVKKKIIKGSWLDNITNNTRLQVEIQDQFQRAIKGKKGFVKFKKDFRENFLKRGGLGALERQVFTRARDLFAQRDREIQLDYADEMELKGFIWSHTVKNTTTDFCKERSNNLYTREFADTWDPTLTWKGKKDDNNIYIDGHGFNCRATLSWVSNELFDRLAKNRKVNEYSII